MAGRCRRRPDGRRGRPASALAFGITTGLGAQAGLVTAIGAGTIDKLAHRDHLFDDLDSALAHARSHVRQLLRSEV